jgi:hypothetical protein
VAKLVWKSVRLFCAGADLTTVNNQVEVKAEVEAQDATAFTTDGNLWTELLPGLRSAEVSGEGQWEAGDLGKVDNVSFGDLGSATPWTIAADGASLASPAYLTSTLRTSYELGGAVGDVAPWKAGGKGTSPLVRGQVLAPPTTASGVSFESGVIQIPGGVAAGQRLYAALHVFSVAGTSTPTIDALVQSDDNSGMTSPVHRITFASATGIGGQWASLAGPLTDDYFQVYADLTGTSPSFLIAVSVGVA